MGGGGGGGRWARGILSCMGFQTTKTSVGGFEYFQGTLYNLSLS